MKDKRSLSDISQLLDNQGRFLKYVTFDEQSREGSIRVESHVCSNPFFLFANSMCRIPVKPEVCGTALFRAEELHDS